MLTLSEAHSTSLDIETPVPLTVDLTLSNDVLKSQPDIALTLYALFSRILPQVWAALVPQVADNTWIVNAQKPGHSLAYSIILVSNPEIHLLNRDFRAKDQPTDVLTFTLADDADAEMPLHALPEVHLGEIYLSVDWAFAASPSMEVRNISTDMLNLPLPLPLYSLERLVHGSLHLLGVHHDTMSDYNEVTKIQRLVLHDLAPTVSRLLATDLAGK